MTNQRTITLFFLIFALISSVFADEKTDQEILKKLNELSEKLEKQDTKIAKQEEELKQLRAKSEGTPLTREQLDKLELENSNQQINDSNKLQLSKYTKSLSLSGDLRLRNETVSQESGSHINRWRTRFRLGSKWLSNDGNYEIGAGLATGGSSANSSNDTWSDDAMFDNGDIRLDYAYLKAAISDNMSLTGGQQKHAFLSTKLFYDGDIRPVGITYSLGKATDKKYTGLFINAGGYLIRNGNDTTDGKGSDSAEQLKAQIGLISELGEASKFKIALTGQTFDSSAIDEVNTDEDAAYDIIDLYASYEIKNITIWGQVSSNIGADGTSILGGLEDADDNNEAYVLGADIKLGKFKLGAHFVHIEADALYPGLADSDYSAGINKLATDAESFIIYGKYYLKKNLEFAIKYIDAKELEGGNLDQDAVQVDLVYKF